MGAPGRRENCRIRGVLGFRALKNTPEAPYTTKVNYRKFEPAVDGTAFCAVEHPIFIKNVIKVCFLNMRLLVFSTLLKAVFGSRPYHTRHSPSSTTRHVAAVCVLSPPHLAL